MSRVFIPLAVVAAVAAVATAPAWADKHAGKIPAVAYGIEKCLPTVLAKQPGDVLQVVLKSEKGHPTWEVEIEAADGKLFDIECSGKTGKITESETRVKSADDPLFKAKMKVTQEQAQATALAKYPGKVERVEYEIEADGRVVYEFDIQPASGPDMRVEVDATSGQITESSVELLEIGRI